VPDDDQQDRQTPDPSRRRADRLPRRSKPGRDLD
jgi:hypothetical protein